MPKFGAKNKPARQQLLEIPVGCLEPNPLQPRQSFDSGDIKLLAESIRKDGVLQPICVRRREDTPEGRVCYEIIAGERRWRAAKEARLPTVPCVLTETTVGDSARLALAENVFRRDLNYFEQAAAMNNIMLVCSLTQSELAKDLGLSQPAVANKLRLLNLSAEERRIILACGYPERTARAFLRVTNAEARLKLIKTAQAHALSPEQCIHRVEAYLQGAKEPARQRKSAAQRLVGAVSDVRFFMNTVDKAINLATAAGFRVEREEADRGDYIELKLTIPKSRKAC